ncbi:MAG: phosphatase PAP2 family protein [Chitinophagaceae bacterium]|nr:phosphatase PAP2 family protein [Chitinophagaceae bacterium]
MKRIVFAILLLMIIHVSNAQPQQVGYPSIRGHYKKLSLLDTSRATGKQKFDAQFFTVKQGETIVLNLYSPDLKEELELIGNGRKRVTHYLSSNEMFSIPNPPANSSAQTRAELDYLIQLQQQRTEEDKRASAFFANVYYRTGVVASDQDYRRMRSNLFHIGRSIGTWFNADTLPATATLVANVWKDAEYYMWKHKNFYLRIRPYKLEPRLQNLEETNWAAYPSGHAMNSYVNAFLFAELLPEFADFFVKDAYDMAHSREIIGVHYPSDSESGRLLAFQLIQRLMKNEKFKRDFQSAKKELDAAKNTKGF